MFAAIVAQLVTQPLSLGADGEPWISQVSEDVVFRHFKASAESAFLEAESRARESRTSTASLKLCLCFARTHATRFPAQRTS